MALVRADGPTLGTAENDIMVDLSGGLSDNIMRGDAGNDLILGDFDTIVENGRSDGNTSIGTALSLDDPALWVKGANPFFNLNGPHTNIFFEPGAGQQRFFELSLKAGQWIAASDWSLASTGSPHQGFGDLYIELLGADGSVLKFVDSTPVYIPADGIYYLRIRESYLSSQVFDGNETKLITIRVTEHEATAPVTLPGRDMLFGGPGDDTLFGFGGNDTLRGNAGNDVMYGGRGNDTFYLEQWGDAIRESVGEGNDTVLVSAKYYMGSEEIETVRLLTADLFVSGNWVSTTFHGSDGHDIIYAGAGDDVLYGNGGDDTLDGDEGSDLLIGGAGLDTLSGGSGADIFRFLEFTDIRDPANGQARERIWDFDASQGDRIDLSAIDAIPGGADDAFVFLGRAAFTGHAGEIRLTSGENMPVLRIDLDGDGRADAIIELYLYSLTNASVAEVGTGLIL